MLTHLLHGWFNRIRQVATMCTPNVVAWINPTQHPNCMRISTAVFAQLTAKTLYFTLGRHFPLKTAPLWGRSGSHVIRGSLGHPSPCPKWHLDWFSGFRTAHDRERLNDRPCYSVCINRLHVRSTAMQPKKFRVKLSSLVNRAAHT